MTTNTKHAESTTASTEEHVEHKNINWSVVVRATVKVLENVEWSPTDDWDIYDHESKVDNDDEDKHVLIRADTLVHVVASSKSEAIEKALDEAPLLTSSGEYDHADLWVDEAQDDDVKPFIEQ